jgi:predicted dehydrogenase
MAGRLRVGVIGLGRRWRRHDRAALAALRGEVRVRAVYDPRRRTAEREARALGCRAADSLTGLLAAADIDAVVLADASWFRLWPLEQAARLGKPFLLGDLAALADSAAAALAERVREQKLPTVAVLPARLDPAYARLLDLLRGELGPARLVLGETGSRSIPGGLRLIDACLGLFGGEPDRAGPLPTLAGGPAGRSLLWADGRAAHLAFAPAQAAPSRPGLHVLAERGTATLVLPGRLAWAVGPVRRTERFAGPALPVRLLAGFIRAARGDAPAVPAFADAVRAAAWLRGEAAPSG